MTQWLLSALLIADPGAQASRWSPPAHPDPSEILEEAVHDRKAGRYEEALAKHVWYHQHALEHQRSLEAVRLSFAVSYWHQLAKVHPPALKAMKKAREDALDSLIRREERGTNKEWPNGEWEDFRDLQAVTRELGDDTWLNPAFAKLHAEKPGTARRLCEMSWIKALTERKQDLCSVYQRDEDLR